MRQNTLLKVDYITIHFVGLAAIIIALPYSWFRKIPGCSLLLTWIIFFVMALLGILIEVLITVRRGRNLKNISVNLISILGCFAMVLYADLLGKRLVIILFGMLAMVLLGIIVIFGRRIRNESSRDKVIKNRKIMYTWYMRYVVFGASLIVLVLQGANFVFADALLVAKPAMVITKYGDEYSLEANLDKLVDLKQERFNKLSLEEKIELCRIVCLVEARYLGISNEIVVALKDLDDGTLGCYVDRLNTVYLDIDHIQNDSTREIVNTCLHEMFHSYTYRLIDAYYEASEKTRDLLFFRQIKTCIDEFGAYDVSGVGDLEGFLDYYFLYVEKEARAYADENTDEYFERINEFFSNVQGE